MISDTCNDQAQNARICLALTCGLPGAGKTSLCNALSAYSKPDVLVRHICFDDIIEFDPKDEGNDFTISGTFKANRHQALQQIEQCMLDGWPAKDAHQRPTLIIADDNMYYRSMRHECAQVARRHNAAFLQIYLPCSLDAALARNERREGSKRMPEEVVRRIATRLEEPDSQKYEWEQNTVTLPSERLPSLADPQSQGWAGVWEKIMEAWKGPLPPAVAPQQQGPPTEASASTAHGLDLQLRRMLADTIASIDGAGSKADAARQLNAERKQLLARACKGEEMTYSEEARHGVVRSFKEMCRVVQAEKCPERA
ncbi:g2843 [Coccomyxa viridis]|uniref:G2843 protein n=1 Tax=Coccomyxa viridis TaxID=1274662 RepID=A0ABP1FRS7_9CHLO